MLTALSLFFS